MNPLTLFELNHFVHGILEHSLRDTYWLQAELSEVSESRGHCYLEFIQKDQSDGRLIAKARGQIWRKPLGLHPSLLSATDGQRALCRNASACSGASHLP